jgi:hypothetical protein
VGDVTQRWWPHPNRFQFFWPQHLPRETLQLETLENFVHAFEWKGFKLCKDAKLETGLEKVAIYTGPRGNPLHASRQLASGAWKSKCGNLQDIEHATPTILECDIYGKVSVYLSRKRT